MNETPTVVRNGAQLVAAGYFQTSRAYRMVGRIPPGKRARDALFEAVMGRTLETIDKIRKSKGGLKSSVFKSLEEMERSWRQDHRNWVNLLDERSVIDHYVRVYAEGEDKLTLTPEEFDSFKAAGGRCA